MLLAVMEYIFAIVVLTKSIYVIVLAPSTLAVHSIFYTIFIKQFGFKDELKHSKAKSRHEASSYKRPNLLACLQHLNKAEQWNWFLF